MILHNLLETNIRQRGIGNTNQKKMGLCIKELTPNTEDELLKSLGLGLTRQTIQNYKKLSEMIPELEELVDTGIVTNTTALAIMKNLSSEEQEQLVSLLDFAVT